MKLKSTKINSSMYGETAVMNDKGYYPSASFTEKSVPELADKKVGDTCKMCIEVKIKSMRSDNQGTMIETEILNAGYMDEDSKEDNGSEDDND